MKLEDPTCPKPSAQRATIPPLPHEVEVIQLPCGFSPFELVQLEHLSARAYLRHIQ
jgi:hypothetical protein